MRVCAVWSTVSALASRPPLHSTPSALLSHRQPNAPSSAAIVMVECSACTPSRMTAWRNTWVGRSLCLFSAVHTHKAQPTQASRGQGRSPSRWRVRTSFRRVCLCVHVCVTYNGLALGDGDNHMSAPLSTPPPSPPVVLSSPLSLLVHLAGHAHKPLGPSAQTSRDTISIKVTKRSCPGPLPFHHPLLLPSPRTTPSPPETFSASKEILSTPPPTPRASPSPHLGSG